MQEEVEAKTVALIINSSKLTAKELALAVKKVLVSIKDRRKNGPKLVHGQQTVKQLISQNQGVSDFEITNKNIKSFERIARKYNVDFAFTVQDGKRSRIFMRHGYFMLI